MRRIIEAYFQNKEVKNASWLIGGKIAQMAISFVVGLWAARYLGPSNYGLISYAEAYITLFTAFCTLGITSTVMINELTNKPNEEGMTLGTTIGLRVVSSALSIVMIFAIVSIVNRSEPITVTVAFISSSSLIFQAFDSIDCWFQKRYLSKVTAVATFSGYCVSAFYKVYLLFSQKSVEWFAFSSTVDFIVYAAILFIVYKKYGGPKLQFSIIRGKQILSVSYHFVLSGMMVAIYSQTDRVMLKHMLSEKEVGYYSTAVTLSTIWVFILYAIINSMAPTIMRLKREGKEEEYQHKNRQLYGLVFYISVAISVCFTIFAHIIVYILYGEEYLGAVNPLRVITWYVAFTFLCVARDSWLVCENKLNYAKYMYLIACLINIGLNFVFIPIWGATGAAVASLITQLMTSIIAPSLFKEMRPNVRLIVEGILLKDNIKKE